MQINAIKCIILLGFFGFVENMFNFVKYFEYLI